MSFLQNRFFELALKKASGVLGKRGRLILLLANMTRKLSQVRWSEVNAASVKEKFFTLGRISRAYASGQYREVPWKTMLIIVAAIVYFVNPLDLLPDIIPITGFTDDVAVLLGVYKAVSHEVDKFLAWERAQVLPS